jgi:AraC-like DNA-binding protein
MNKLGVQIQSIDLGHAMVLLPKNFQIDLIKERLNQIGFELIWEKDDLYVENIKVLVLAYLKLLEEAKELHVLSDFITKRIGKNYNYLTKVFSQHCDMTIEQYFIKQRLQRVKQLLDQGELNVTEISYKLCYSSVNYLSSQFKKCIGLSVSEYKSQLDELKRVYKEISSHTNDLKKQGIDLTFSFKDNKYYCEETNEYFAFDEIAIIEKFKYAFKNNNSKLAKVSVVLTSEKRRGVLVEIPEPDNNYSKVIS